jgi:hypothetical protein
MEITMTEHQKEKQTRELKLRHLKILALILKRILTYLKISLSTTLLLARKLWKFYFRYAL